MGKVAVVTMPSTDGENIMRIGGWIQTASGKQFWPYASHPDDFDIEDIASALSKQCRFSGHCREFYSVAQHSVLVSENVPPQHALWGLLHDASEAYLSDIPTPIKNYLNEYQKAELEVMRNICKAFGLDTQMPQSVKDVDMAMLATEKRDLMAPEPAPWFDMVTPYTWSIEPWPPAKSKLKFLERFFALTGQAASRALEMERAQA